MPEECEAGEGCTTITTCLEADGYFSRDLIIASNPIGSGGIALNCNFKELHFRQPKCNYEGGAQPVGDDKEPTYCRGSRWLDENLPTRR